MSSLIVDSAYSHCKTSFLAPTNSTLGVYPHIILSVCTTTGFKATRFFYAVLAELNALLSHVCVAGHASCDHALMYFHSKWKILPSLRGES